ncbi:MAG: glycosyltransferase [Ilumatobacteraceae bacterium]
MPSEASPTRAVPRISVVVPAYNRERFLGPTIDSIVGQTMSGWELVVVDDGSTDGTLGVGQRYADADERVRVLSGPNGGVARARNRGFDATDVHSEFVVFLDSDDIWDPDALATLAAALDAHPEYVSVYGLARCIDAEGRPIPGDDLEEWMRARKALTADGLVPLGAEDPMTFAGLVAHNWGVTPGTNLIRRSVIEQVGLFDPDTDPCDDWDMAIRVSRQGQVGFVPHPVLWWRRHDDTLSETSPRLRQAHLRVRRNTFIWPGNTPEQRRLAGLAYRKMCRDSLRTAWGHVGDGQLRRSARPVAKAALGYLEYLRADVRVRLRR